MKTTLSMAILASGITAGETCDEEFLSHQNWGRSCRLATEYGNLVVGRETYETAKE